jgi:hypothetical protein
MLDQLGLDRDWTTAALAPPFGRGLNLEIAANAPAAAGWPLCMAPDTKAYRIGARRVTVRQFLVQDPVGYLLRFSQELVEPPDAP